MISMISQPADGSLIWCRRGLLWEMHAAVSDFDAGDSLKVLKDFLNAIESRVEFSIVAFFGLSAIARSELGIGW